MIFFQPFATDVIDNGSKFATGNKDTAVLVAKFAAGVVDMGGAS
jgi:hypothetical protein